jgi:cellulose synthase/poly-beta-1,6-N-acetylglucosamine synthase-like glycosyltransferase
MSLFAVLDWSVWAWLLYGTIWLILSVFGMHRGWLVLQHQLHARQARPEPPLPATPPTVLVQLPIFNERYVAPRLIRAVAALDYPRASLEIQVLDDSTDDTPQVVAPVVAELQAQGFQITHLRRESREGYKAGALAWGLERSAAPYIAIFDADFVPAPDFLQRTVGYFTSPQIGMVQTRWEHLNRDFSLLTRAQSILLDGHFVIEHTARHRSGCFFNFNGTAGIWRRAAIVAAGGWQHDTVTEDLDLSYRAQSLGWKFIYLDQLTTPAELPVEICDFKTQQYRWTKGAMQTCRKVLWRVLTAPVPFKCKVEASFHLLSNLCYPLMVLMALMLGPMCWLRNEIQWNAPLWLDLPLLLATTISMLTFYFRSQVAIGRGNFKTAGLMPAVLCLGLGMSLNNAWASIEGLFRHGGEFVRTPKYHVTDGAAGNPVTHRNYAHTRSTIVPWLELFMFIYMLLVDTYNIALGQWLAIPFVTLFVGGFGYVAMLTWRGRWQHAHPTLPLPTEA